MIEKLQIIPSRSAESLKKCWQSLEKTGLRNHVENKNWYSNGIRLIPRVDLKAFEEMAKEQSMIRLKAAQKE